MINTRDCPELYPKNNPIDARKLDTGEDGEEEDCVYDCGYALSQLCEMFPFCTKQQIESLMAQYGGDESMIRLTKFHQEQEQAARQRELIDKTSKESKKSKGEGKQFSGLVKQERQFPKLSLEKEWEMIDEMDDWTKLEPVDKPKTWAEKLKENNKSS
mmetsp:Transcript_3025/g.7014  ORF Transcript_3025/g.7014 Transcript_3025/m.7014 type:complete len:158 (+) Transcript_3025:418-891(+)|eukprot:CAMPEP_0178999442 /NCGR_PEP_ID=MMETSP0795-20121207/10067_1 /TAXON_ID=88552 /ORGANISM="Amoebophrya sp., Strain Ameob2" /LENGTH=157 /DNA_ID=CAMNT_0020692225 /DNA_START=406 /DNA_END=879 /DNA_ORIENTATION=+